MSTAATAAARPDSVCAHPALTKPALLSHIFKFAVRRHADVKLLFVDTAWEETCVSYCAWMWQRLISVREGRVQAGPLSGAVSVEEHARHAFNHYLCSVWLHVSSAQSLLRRLALPRKLDVQYRGSIRDASIAHLVGPNLQSLEELNLSGLYMITDLAMKHVGELQLQNLRQLFLTGCCRLTDIGIAHIRGMPLLQHLDVAFCEALSDDGVAHLSKIVTLRQLRLEACDAITDVGVQHISGLQELQSLDLSRCCEITDLRPLAGLRQLQTLNVARCKSITDVGVQPISKIATLRDLRIDDCEKLTDEALRYISSLTLTRLNVQGCFLMTDAAKKKFREAHPNCSAQG